MAILIRIRTHNDIAMSNDKNYFPINKFDTLIVSMEPSKIRMKF